MFDQFTNAAMEGVTGLMNDGIAVVAALITFALIALGINFLYEVITGAPLFSRSEEKDDD
jgi:hypothetical protein